MKTLIVNFEDGQAEWLRQKDNFSEFLRLLVARSIAQEKNPQPNQPSEISDILSSLSTDEQAMMIQMTKQATDAAQAKRDFEALSEKEKTYLTDMAVKQEKPLVPGTIEFWQFVKHRLALAKKLNGGKLMPEEKEVDGILGAIPKEG